jgi:hypothetical protein
MIDTAETLWAWVVEEDDGSIGTIAVYNITLGGWMNLITRSEEAARKMTSFAIAHGEASGRKVWLRKYQLVQEIGKIK